MSEAEIANPVKLIAAKSTYQALVIRGILESSGIPAFVTGQVAGDEFSMSQRLMNMEGVDVLVSSVHLDKARDVLEAYRELGRATEDAELSPILDVDWVREQFPACKTPWALFDNAGGSVPTKRVIESISDFLTTCPVQLGASYDLSREASARVAEGRRAMAAWIGADDDEVVLGPSTTSNAKRLSLALRPLWQEGDEVVVTDLDHEANIGAWRALASTGIVIREWPFDLETATLRYDDLEPLLSERTRAVCFTHCSNVVGALHDVTTIATKLKSRGILSIVDGVAFAPHRQIDVRALGVDAYLLSTYKTFGPHQGLMYVQRDLFRRARNQNHFFYGDEDLPAKLEPGGVNYELVASLPAIVDYVTQIAIQDGIAETSPLPLMLDHAYRMIADHESSLARPLIEFLNEHPRTRIIGPSTWAPQDRVATIAFYVDDLPSSEVSLALDQHKIAVRHGHFYAHRAIEKLGLLDKDGIVRVSMLHYNTFDEVSRLTEQLDRLLT